MIEEARFDSQKKAKKAKEALMDWNYFSWRKKSKGQSIGKRQGF